MTSIATAWEGGDDLPTWDMANNNNAREDTGVWQTPDLGSRAIRGSIFPDNLKSFTCHKLGAYILMNISLMDQHFHFPKIQKSAYL